MIALPSKVHPVLEIFPPLSERKIQNLADSIKRHGQVEAILLSNDGDTILDGRARLRACWIAGVEPKFERLEEDRDEADAVLARNLYRANYGADQIAVITAQREEMSGIPVTVRLDEEEAERLRMARVVVRANPRAVEGIMSGAMRVSRVYADVEARRRTLADEIRRREALPLDLRIEVNDEALTLSEAEAVVAERTRIAEEQRKKSKPLNAKSRGRRMII